MSIRHCRRGNNAKKSNWIESILVRRLPNFTHTSSFHLPFWTLHPENKSSRRRKGRIVPASKITFSLILNHLFWLKCNHIKVFTHFSQAWAENIISIFQPGFRLWSTFMPKCFCWSTECLRLWEHLFCSLLLASRLKHSKAFAAIYWQGEPEALWRPSSSPHAKIRWPRQITIPHAEILSGLICVGERKIISYLPYLTVFIASTREVNPNTLRCPLCVWINSFLVLLIEKIATQIRFHVVDCRTCILKKAEPVEFWVWSCHFISLSGKAGFKTLPLLLTQSIPVVHE